MGEPFPSFPADVLNGDEPSHPLKNSLDRSILAVERGTQSTRRLQTDTDRNLYVRLAEDDTLSSTGVLPLATGAVVGVTDSTLTTIVTYVAPSVIRVSKISASGTAYAKFQLFLNASLIDTKRSGPERSVDFDFDIPLALAASDILDVKVTHYYAGLTEDFEATVYGG